MADEIARERLHAALATATAALLAELGADGHWTGELSSSALSTATAVVALATADARENVALISNGLRWLADHANADGGWGDTVRSRSNLSTTALCWAAFGAVAADAEYPEVVQRAEAHLFRGAPAPPRADFGAPAEMRHHAPQGKPEGGSGGESRLEFTALSAATPVAAGAPRPAREGAGAPRMTLAALNPSAAQDLAARIAARYGKDRTFSVPILMTLALAGRIGWEHVMPLPFELAALPHQVFGAASLPVVSYALPALIAIGQTIHFHRPTRNPLTRLLRVLTKQRTLRILAAIQPENGGFLEATPLTSFVTMSLASMGLREHAVTQRGIAFLRASVRADGSWPIDTNLATWSSTLAIRALAHQPATLTPEQRLGLREWLLGQQYRVEHPYTHAAPGGWAWTDLAGGVPDADDTASALLALLQLGAVDPETRLAGIPGVRWLLDLQNRDGGIPTFCRGWGALPFDRSAPDLTAHALRAWSAWLPQLDERLKKCALRAIKRGLIYLARTQRADGAWLPLWFGNEHAPDDENPVYGTAQVVRALWALREAGFAIPESRLRAGERWLAQSQAADGGWGSTEETALALGALIGTEEVAVVEAGARWLVERVESGTWREPAPIGFYFAKLWYFERLYPLIFTAGALGKLAALRTE